MRNPRNPYTNNTIYIYNATSSRAPAIPATRPAARCTIAWRAVVERGRPGLRFADGKHKYWVANIAAGAYQATNVVEYCLAVTYNDHDTTYLGTTNGGVASVPTPAWPRRKRTRSHSPWAGRRGPKRHSSGTTPTASILGSGASSFGRRIGYAQGHRHNRWVDYAAIYYTTTAWTRPARPARPATPPHPGPVDTFDHMERIRIRTRDAMWWAGVVSGCRPPTAARSSTRSAREGRRVERFADTNRRRGQPGLLVSLFVAGAAGLTVNGVNADYTTTKFFIDEAAGETHTSASFMSRCRASNVQVFLQPESPRLLRCGLLQLLDPPDGYADGIKPPDGNLIRVEDTGAYFTAFANERRPTTYYWTGAVSRCGAYRLTARYQKNATTRPTGSGIPIRAGLRDHAVVASPKKVLQQTCTS
jgi:hypothetical protein